MDWIKKHYDQFALSLLALLLLAFSVMLILRARNFGSGFAAATATAIPRDKVPPVSLELIEAAKEALKTPPQWNEADSHIKAANEEKKRGSLFVSDLYVIGKDGTPQKPSRESFWKDSLTEQPIKNIWFMDNRLPLLDRSVPLQDPDKDGFPNEDEWRAGTDPNNKDSHPAYVTKLFVKQFIRVPFRLLFNAYDGDPTTDKIDKFAFQLNTIDLRQPSEFLKIGDTVKNTKFKLDKFEYKTQLNPKTGEQEDVSELTIVNIETKEPLILVLNRVTDSPDYFMRFAYKWPNPPIEFTVKKRQDFVLKPNIDEKYNLVDSQEGKAQVKGSDGKLIEIIPDPRDGKTK